MLRFTVALLAAIIAASPAWATHRSNKARQQFVRAAPCPSTGNHKLPCPGYIIDHVTPLCAGGPDNPGNMQWQTIAAAKEKDKDERRMCRSKPR